MFRHLRARGFDVNYVRNLTDVDDKIINRAHELGEDPHALSERFIVEFHQRRRVALPPAADASSRASPTTSSRSSPSAKSSINNGVAYAAQGDVYFSVKDLPSYGQLSGQPLDQLESGARVEVDTQKKRGPLDFALWKAAKPGEPSWPSPWGAGRPGWHIECSAMAERYLGATFDMHGGGVDSDLPASRERARAVDRRQRRRHVRARLDAQRLPQLRRRQDLEVGHVDEGAVQARLQRPRRRRAPRRRGAARVPAHHAISQSAQLRRDPRGRRSGHRAAFACPVSRSPSAAASTPISTLEKLRAQLATGKSAGEGAVAPESESWLTTLQSALDDDFNTAEALARVERGAGARQPHSRRQIGRAQGRQAAHAREARSRSARRRRRARARHADPTAWLAEHRARRCKHLAIDAAEIDQRIADRSAARKAKDFATADAIRVELSARKIEIMDTPRGTTWRIAD